MQTPEKLVLWQKSASYRCADCEPKTFVELAKTGCRSCGVSPAPTRANQLEVFKAASAGLDKQLDQIRETLEKLKSIPLTGDTMTTKENVLKRRDQWVEEHRRTGETVFQTRVRFWKAHPEAKEQSRTAPAGKKTVEPTFGQTVSAAIERRARQYHIDEPRTLDKSIAELKVHIRKTLPALARLERSQDSVEIAKSAYAGSVDPHVRQALEFVRTWSE